MANPNSAKLPKNSSDESGRSGTIISHGIITNEDYNRSLTGIAGNKMYEIMRRSDSTVRSALQIVKLPILSTTWSIEPVKDEDGNITPEDEEKANHIKRELFHRNVNFQSIIKHALTELDFGFSIFEKVFELVEFEGSVRIGIKKLAPRKQVSVYKWLTRDDQPGITQQTVEGQFDIPREKLIVFTHDKEGDNYEGISLLRSIYKDWDIKDKLVIINAIALERQGIGVPIVKARENASPTPADQEAAVDALSNLRANEKAYLKIPETMEVTMLDMKGSTTKEIIPSLNYHDGRIMTGVLARFMELGGASGTGSQALSGDLSSIFMKAEEALANELVATLMDDLIKQLCDLNYADMSSGYPQLTYGAIADDDNVALANSISQLMTAGALTADADLEDNVRERFRLPLMSKETRASYGEEEIEGITNEKEVNQTKKETKKLSKDDDVKAAVAEAKKYRNKLLASLSQD